MKKIFFVIAFFANCLLFADDGLTGLYDFKKLPINEIEVEIASLVPEDIEDPDYTDCNILQRVLLCAHRCRQLFFYYTGRCGNRYSDLPNDPE